MLKRRFTNILKVEKKRSGMAVCLCLVACILFISSSMQAALTRCLHAFTSLNHTQTANADQVHVVDDKEMLPLSAYNLKYSKTSPELHVWAH